MNISTLLCEVPEYGFMPLHLNIETAESTNSSLLPDVIDINQGASEICISYSISIFSLANVKAIPSNAFTTSYSVPFHYLVSNYNSTLTRFSLNNKLNQL